MNSQRLIRLAALWTMVGASLWSATSTAAEAPSAAQALALTPIQQHVEYAMPTKEEAAQCTNSAEKVANVTAWVVRNRQNEILRRFADTNGDNVVDQWCYYLGGLEAYRDIDANFNGKADQYRWFHTGGSRWGVDKNEDGRIDAWRVISAHEVGEQVIIALKTNDAARFALLLASPAELNEAGFSKTRDRPQSRPGPAARPKMSWSSTTRRPSWNPTGSTNKCIWGRSWLSAAPGN